jgi:hypothetical protein
MDDLAKTWKDKKAKDEDKEFRLQAVFDWVVDDSAKFGDVETSLAFMGKEPKVLMSNPPQARPSVTLKEVMEDLGPQPYKRKGGRPKGSKNKKSDSLESMPEVEGEDWKKGKFQYTADELKKESKAIDKAIADDKSKATPPLERLRRAVREVIKPLIAERQPSADGFKHFVINTNRHGEDLPTNGWKEALKAEGINCARLEFNTTGLQVPVGMPAQIDVMII